MSQAEKPSEDVEIPGNEVFVLSDEAFDRFEQQLNDSPMSDNEALQALLKRPTPWR
ncbi:DUF1778 domain-containing protein [Pseudomonas putida]|uniref:Uncharacterized protein n=1 Tax=Pseudomonas putida TaxID=303 RepID=A0A8I1ED04_PSEPU|nr:DUF1778 domain-containing protein [Pseudomonas putida]MBI6883097.1 hypothetical protein [Pseudomonas putida]